MKVSRPVAIAAAVLAFAVIVFALLPPTKPIGGARIGAGSHGFAPVETKPVRSAPPPSVEPPVAADQTSRSQAAPAADEERDGDPEEGDDTLAPPPPASADPEQGYRAGFRWARTRDVQDPRECRLLPDPPAIEGCRDYAREANARDDRREELF